MGLGAMEKRWSKLEVHSLDLSLQHGDTRELGRNQIIGNWKMESWGEARTPIGLHLGRVWTFGGMAIGSARGQGNALPQ